MNIYLASLNRTFNFILKHPLAKRHKFSAFYKLIYWQFKTLFSKELIAVRFIENTKFWAKKKLTGITGNIYVGLHEFEDMAFLIHFLRKDDVFFDIGANVGSYTILASGLKGAKTIAFEPIKETFNILLKNITLNNLQQNVECYQMAVGSKKSTLHFTTDQDTTNHYVQEATNSSAPTQVIDLDYYYPNLSPILLKIDVEGFETEVIKGSTKILESKQLCAIIIELNGSGNRYGYSDTVIHEKLLALSFKPYIYNPFTRKLENKNQYGNYNTIYVRDFDFVSERLTVSQSFVVFNEKI